MSRTQEWSKTDAERHIGQVFEGAKNGATQKIKDADGTFELRFVPSSEKPSAGEYLSRGGPNEM
ncbi:hypothetical protein [Rhizobium leguminosarum]|uniref:hypothetical protein n=1 Tax=Rhizobium leguminosarum TaxID=384 RepID=UPI001441134F|nr:hypothetical protein [Rhizobium leguminosarum]NKM95689.1 hypothetical protein [Rhizobium leguminosarum bv. viciae]